jgi:hypothetical protein
MNIQTTGLFKQLPSYSKVWIYQSNKQIDDITAEKISNDVKQFVAGWTAHSEKVIADGAVLFNYFVVLVADENAVKVSGCSIDSSVHFIQILQEKYGLNFFDRFYTVYADGTEIKGADKDTFRQLLDEGNINSETPVFNTLIQTLEQLQHNWMLPLKQSWHKRVFNFPVTQ